MTDNGALGAEGTSGAAAAADRARPGADEEELPEDRFHRGDVFSRHLLMEVSCGSRRRRGWRTPRARVAARCGEGGVAEARGRERRRRRRRRRRPRRPYGCCCCCAGAAAGGGTAANRACTRVRAASTTRRGGGGPRLTQCTFHHAYCPPCVRARARDMTAAACLNYGTLRARRSTEAERARQHEAQPHSRKEQGRRGRGAVQRLGR